MQNTEHDRWQRTWCLGFGCRRFFRDGTNSCCAHGCMNVCMLVSNCLFACVFVVYMFALNNNILVTFDKKAEYRTQSIAMDLVP